MPHCVRLPIFGTQGFDLGLGQVSGKPAGFIHGIDFACGFERGQLGPGGNVGGVGGVGNVWLVGGQR